MTINVRSKTQFMQIPPYSNSGHGGVGGHEDDEDDEDGGGGDGDVGFLCRKNSCSISIYDNSDCGYTINIEACKLIGLIR